MASIPIANPTQPERMALFRHAIVGDLVVSDLAPGALNKELRRRAEKRYRPPGSDVSRTYHWKTFQRWLHAARCGLRELQPASRKRGFALALDEEARELLVGIRREHPHVAAEVILDEVVKQGALREGAISLPTLRRLYAREGLTRASRTRHQRQRDRRRWEADRVCRIWHADVCHAWRTTETGETVKVYIHGILDDHSRYVLALMACESETENDLLGQLAETLTRYPAPDRFYVDNGATYRGDMLTLALDRLGVRCLHAAPYDPEARGKMERFWRTLRQRLLDVDETPRTLHDYNAALLAWLDADYHPRKHAGLFGDTPARRFRQGVKSLPSPRSLRDIAKALVIHKTAKVRKDATFSVFGTRYEVRGRHLAGKSIQVDVDPFTKAVLGVSLDATAVTFGPCDAIVNGKTGRGDATDTAATKVHRFERISSLLKAAREVTDEA